MRFEAREVNPYSTPLTQDELDEGSAYFMVSFVDSGMRVPEVRPVIFIGTDLDEGDTGQAYFQDYDSYSAGEHYGEEARDSEFIVVSLDNMNNFFRFDAMLELLLACSIRRSQL
jgi:hypothetical protein